MDRLVLILAALTFISTLLGGLIIIKFRKYLHVFFAFAAGSIIAVAFLDLLPESLNVAEGAGLSVRSVMLMVVFSFFFYSLLERFFLTHHVHDGDSHGHIMGPIGAGSLVVHSFLDGAAIGAAFQVNASVGLIVALAVIFHDFTDGINTVTLMLKNKHKVRKAVIFLIFDALAPALGIIVTASLVIPSKVLALLLAMFVGEFLYIGASNLLPETREHMSKGIIVAMALGIILITVLTSFLAF
jgi:ZIP family zinc transporter